jgi:hypothetical protein
MFSYTNVPVASIGTDVMYTTPRGELTTFFNTTTPTAGAAVNTLKLPTIPGATTIIDSRFTSALGEHHVIDWGASAPYSLDLTGVVLDDYAQFPVFDIPSHTLGWTTTAGATPDFSVSDIRVFRSVDGRQWQWTIASPQATGTVTFPVLPSDVHDFVAVDTDSVNVNGLLTARLPGGYDAVRAGILDADLAQLDTLAVGTTAPVSVETLQPVTRTAASVGHRGHSVGVRSTR